MQSRTVNLVTRILLAIVIAGLLPFVGLALFALNGYRVASTNAEHTAAAALDDAASTALLQRTEQTANALGVFLDERADDTRQAALLPPDPLIFSHFVAHTRPLWYVTGTRAQPVEHHDPFPLYREMVMTDATGHVMIHVIDGTLVSEPGDPIRSAAYDDTARMLAPDALSVSHLVRRYVPEPSDQSTRLAGVDYLAFNGVYRFIAARRTADGTFNGAVMLALDARFLMEFTDHIVSTESTRAVVWSDFASGDYSYLDDNEGFSIAYPNLWAVRGDDANGRPVPAAHSSAELPDHPLNDAQGGWIDANRPLLVAEGLAGKNGSLLVTNTAGVTTLKTYAPIPFTEGTYHDRGVFGIVVIGANLSEFHQSASAVRTVIAAQRNTLQSQMAVVAVLGLLILALAGTVISRMLVRPLHTLTGVAAKLKQGELDESALAAIRERRIADEVTVLAEVFLDMGRQVVRREQQLRTEIAELHIKIDGGRRQAQVDEITETDYFQTLRANATRLRARRAGPPAESTNAPASRPPPVSQ